MYHTHSHFHLGLLNHFMNCSRTNEVELKSSTRLGKLKRMLLSGRDNAPVIRMCSNITVS